MKKKVIIIGGGASGCMAALSAAKEGAEVLLLEQNERVGRKLLSTGNGRCNFTNLLQESSCYRSDNTDFPWLVIQKFPESKTISFFEGLGIYPKSKNGYIYPWSEQASAIRDALEAALNEAGVTIVTGVRVQEIVPTKKGFLVSVLKNGKKEKISGDRLILSAGSRAASKLGSDGSGYDLAKKLGHRLIPVVPALVQLRCREKLYRQLAGVRTQGKVTLFIDGKEVASDTGELQLTDYGISGIPVFQVSRYAAKGLYEKKEVTAELDFMPDLTDEDFTEMLRERRRILAHLTMHEYFTGLFHRKLADALLKRISVSGTTKIADLGEETLGRLSRLCKHFHTYIDQTNAFEQAQICAGGVDTREIDPDTMQSRIVPGLFFAGEILDVDGICGGYNLQWAWTSGYLAGKGAVNA